MNIHIHTYSGLEKNAQQLTNVADTSLTEKNLHYPFFFLTETLKDKMFA